jgi:hypothetical protein
MNGILAVKPPRLLDSSQRGHDFENRENSRTRGWHPIRKRLARLLAPFPEHQMERLPAFLVARHDILAFDALAGLRVKLLAEDVPETLENQRSDLAVLFNLFVLAEISLGLSEEEIEPVTENPLVMRTGCTGKDRIARAPSSPGILPCLGKDPPLPAKAALLRSYVARVKGDPMSSTGGQETCPRSHAAAAPVCFWIRRASSSLSGFCADSSFQR